MGSTAKVMGSGVNHERWLMAGSQESLDRFEAQTAWPMLVLSLLIIPLLIIPLVVDLSPSTETTIFTLDWILWGLFALEYGIRLYLAPVKGRFVRSNIIDLVVVVVPFLRPLRVARSARVLRLMGLARVGIFVLRALAAVRAVLTRHKLHYALLIVTLITITAGVLVWVVELDEPEANINSVGDGLWWAVTTLTTVGYGDRFPTSPMGKGIAVVLMLVGVALLGLLAANLASILIRGLHDEPESTTELQIAEMAERLERMEQLLEKLQPSDEGSDDSQDSNLDQAR
jgi:voltage-gated potassium channel